MPAVVFDKARFQAAYPEVQATDAQLEMWFTQAESLLDNTDHSIVEKLEDREMLLFLLVRHFAALAERAAQGGLVGRIASATEGSVSVSADMGAVGSNVSANALWRDLLAAHRQIPPHPLCAGRLLCAAAISSDGVWLGWHRSLQAA